MPRFSNDLQHLRNKILNYLKEYNITKNYNLIYGN